MLRTGRKREADELHAKLRRACKNDDGALFNLGLMLAQAGQFGNAASCFRQVLKLAPRDAEACFNLGKAYAMQNLAEKAEACYRNALRIKPDFAEACQNLCNILYQGNRLQEAEEYARRLLALRPDDAGAHNNLGLILASRGKTEDARRIHNQALHLNPGQAETYNHLGRISYDAGDLDHASEIFHKALQLKPDFDQAHWNLATIQLLTGDFKHCWPGYERRISPLKSETDALPYRPWDGTPLAGRSLLISAEQGIGDQIMFASCLPELGAQRGRIILECDARLKPLFSRAFPGISVIGRKERREARLAHLTRIPVDFHLPIGSLPKHLRRDLSCFPADSAYLIPDQHAFAQWKKRLTALGGGLKVGISWKGGTAETALKRSTTLAQWQDIFSIPGLALINLQYGDFRDELRDAERNLGITIHDWKEVDPLKDLDHFAALIAALDLVISVDNSTVHLAGALGRPVWTLLPFMPDWRWMLEREDSPWYPTMRLFRQRSPGQWQPVFERVAHELKSVIASNDCPR